MPGDHFVQGGVVLDNQQLHWRFLGLGKQFFFEKKHQKTFTQLSLITPRQPSKSFCVFFQKEALS
jgi:hypothetical protein